MHARLVILIMIVVAQQGKGSIVGTATIQFVQVNRGTVVMMQRETRAARVTRPQIAELVKTKQASVRIILTKLARVGGARMMPQTHRCSASHVG